MSFAKELRESFDECLIGRKDIAGDGSFISLLVGNFLIDREIGEGIDFFLKQGDQVVVRGRLNKILALPDDFLCAGIAHKESGDCFFPFKGEQGEKIIRYLRQQ